MKCCDKGPLEKSKNLYDNYQARSYCKKHYIEQERLKPNRKTSRPSVRAAVSSQKTRKRSSLYTQAEAILSAQNKDHYLVLTGNEM